MLVENGIAVLGMLVHLASAAEQAGLSELLGRFGLIDKIVCESTANTVWLRLSDVFAKTWAPDFDTTGLTTMLALDTSQDEQLAYEILVALLASPVRVEFPSLAELQSALRMRANIVRAARRTTLNFHTEQADRPEDCWRDDEENGFVILPGYPLAEALRRATQPGPSGRIYAFSCYRATEYVILLGIAEELAQCNPDLLAQLQRQCETRMIRSGRFHDVFLREYGTQDTPVPARYYVPGDRVWFRNPDQHSSDVLGFEGSWVLYLGDGLFTNFWACEKPYTLTAKCLEIYHWRHGVTQGDDGERLIDEAIVASRVAESQASPAEMDRILAEMMRFRDPKGCYSYGGCIDTTRESPRWVCAGTADMALNAASADMG